MLLGHELGRVKEEPRSFGENGLKAFYGHAGVLGRWQKEGHGTYMKIKATVWLGKNTLCVLAQRAQETC